MLDGVYARLPDGGLLSGTVIHDQGHVIVNTSVVGGRTSSISAAGGNVRF